MNCGEITDCPVFAVRSNYPVIQCGHLTFNDIAQEAVNLPLRFFEKGDTAGMLL
jgi:hypothetical protein